MRSILIRWSTHRQRYSLKLPTGCRFVRKRLPTNSSLDWVSLTESHFVWVLPTKSYFCWKLPTEKFKSYRVTHRKMFLFKCYPHKSVLLVNYPQKTVIVWGYPQKWVSLKRYPQKGEKGLGLPIHMKLSQERKKAVYSFCVYMCMPLSSRSSRALLGPPYCTPPVCVCVLLCFIKPILGNHYVWYGGFIVSKPREKHPRSEIANIPTSRVTISAVLGALAVCRHNNNKTKIGPGRMAQTPAPEPLAGLGDHLW